MRAAAHVHSQQVAPFCVLGYSEKLRHLDETRPLLIDSCARKKPRRLQDHQTWRPVTSDRVAASPSAPLHRNHVSSIDCLAERSMKAAKVSNREFALWSTLHKLPLTLPSCLACRECAGDNGGGSADRRTAAGWRGVRRRQLAAAHRPCCCWASHATQN